MISFVLVFDITIVSLLLSVSSIVIAGLGLWFVRRDASRLEIVGNALDAYVLVREFRDRLEKLERTVVEYRVKWEVMELRGWRLQYGGSGDGRASKLKVGGEERETGGQAGSATRSVGGVSLIDQEIGVLKIVLEKGKVSAREVQLRIGKSREHTSRMMKSLFKKGLLLRDSSVRPFQYSLSETGKLFVGA